VRKIIVGLVLAATLLAGTGPAFGYDDGGENGNGNDSRRCDRAAQNCRGSFSPGPFDRSPVDASHNQICVMPNSCSSQGKDKPPADQQPKSLGCLVPVPYHCDPKPASLTNPSKLPSAIASIAKAGLDLGRLFADGTITFIETMFTALA
jgi:hypothetical protein